MARRCADDSERHEKTSDVEQAYASLNEVKPQATDRRVAITTVDKSCSESPRKCYLRGSRCAPSLG